MKIHELKEEIETPRLALRNCSTGNQKAIIGRNYRTSAKLQSKIVQLTTELMYKHKELEDTVLNSVINSD